MLKHYVVTFVLVINKLIIQWGIIASTSCYGGKTITFPTAYNTYANVNTQMFGSTIRSAYSNSNAVSSKSTTSFTLHTEYGESRGQLWISIGY